MKLVSAVALALAFPASAGAALEVKLAVVPDSPKKGVSTVVQLRLKGASTDEVISSAERLPGFEKCDPTRLRIDFALPT